MVNLETKLFSSENWVKVKFLKGLIILSNITSWPILTTLLFFLAYKWAQKARVLSVKCSLALLPCNPLAF